MSDWKYLYVIEHPHGYKKIGKAANPEGRMNGLQTGSPYELERWLVVKYLEPSSLVYRDSLEQMVHDAIEDYHVRGEWFEIPDSQLLHALAMLVDIEDEGREILTYTEYKENEKRRKELRSKAYSHTNL